MPAEQRWVGVELEVVVVEIESRARLRLRVAKVGVWVGVRGSECVMFWVNQPEGWSIRRG